jgi:Ca-activated chloride channel family protein
MQAGYVVATRMNTDIEARVSGLVARVSVSQSFRNDGQEWVEGIYVFPLPDAAAVDRFRRKKNTRRRKLQARKRAWSNNNGPTCLLLPWRTSVREK